MAKDLKDVQENIWRLDRVRGKDLRRARNLERTGRSGVRDCASPYDERHKREKIRRKKKRIMKKKLLLIL